MATTESDRATITLRFLASPGDAGHSGSVSAGRVLEWIDKAGYAAAAGWSGRYCVTAYVGNVRFARPVEVGELVEATATLVYTGRTSMHITVTVSSGHPRTRELTEATHCLMVFVAVDDDGRATPVPTWTPASTSQIESRDWAVRRITLREQIEAALTSHGYTDAGTAIFIDGPVHERDDKAREDSAAQERLLELGYGFVRFRSGEDWLATIREHAEVFGKGRLS